VVFSAGVIVDRAPAALPSGDCVIGRATEGRRDLCLPDDGRLSRKHAVIKRRGDVLSVHDLESHNGTRVNGLDAKKAGLVSGDLIRCGDTFVLVRRTPIDLDAPATSSLVGRSPAMAELRAWQSRSADWPSV
jgi:pSer/pThr/pTyr-binding forkhead associated (FHA) protein